MANLSNLNIPGLCMVGCVGALVKTEASLIAIQRFAKSTRGVVVAVLENDNVVESISDALAEYDGKPCLLHDLNTRMCGRFLILVGVDPCKDEVLEALKIVTAQADCPVVAVIVSRKPWADIAAQLVAERIAQRIKFHAEQTPRVNAL